MGEGLGVRAKTTVLNMDLVYLILLAILKPIGNFSITAGKDRSQGLSKEAKSGLTER